MISGYYSYGLGQDVSPGFLQTPPAQYSVLTTPIGQFGSGEWLAIGAIAILVGSLLFTGKRAASRVHDIYTGRRKRAARQYRAMSEFYR